MSRIKVSSLLNLFERMYSQGWEYVSGGASEGAVDCSGAFTYAFRKLGGQRIDHGSNSIYHRFVEIGNAPKPGYAAFKVRGWEEDQSGNRWYGQAPGDVYHIGLVDKTGKYVLNAKGTKYGFCKDRLSSSWAVFGKLKYVDYEGGDAMITANTATVNTTSGTLNVREEADKNSKILGKLTKGSTVEILQENGDWTQIRHESLSGWVSSAYLKKDDEAENAENKITITDSEGNIFSPVGWFKVVIA